MQKLKPTTKNIQNLIHWWELSKTTHICLSKEFILKIRNKRIKLNYTQQYLAKLLGVHEATIREWEKGRKNPNIKKLLILLNELKIPKENIYGHIIFIRGRGKSRKIGHPPLPYKEKPEHIQIISHGFFDGTLAHASERMIGGLLYQSADGIEQSLFKKLVMKSKFGTFTPSKNKKNEYSLPSVLTQLLMSHYKIFTLSSKDAKFSNHIMDNKDINWKNTILKAAYIDEGSCGKKRVRDNLSVFSSSNPLLIRQVSTILKSLQYKFFVYRGNTATSIILNSTSLQKFYKDIISILPKNYYKRKNAFILLKRQDRDINIKKQLNKIEKIIKIKGKIKMIEIQDLLNIHEASARRRLARLIKMQKVIRKGWGRYEIN